MGATKPGGSDMKVQLVFYIAVFLSLLNGLAVFPLCYVIYRIVPNFLLFIFVATFMTCTVFQGTMNLFNLMGVLAFLIEKKFPWSPISDFLTFLGSWILVIQGKILHGYEIHGMENLPKKTGALLVYHHALVPYDVLYLMADYYLERRRKLGGVIHENLRICLFGVSKLFHFISERDQLTQELKDGYIRTVAPGGSREAVFSQNYELMWNGRKGFAEVAKQTGVPIIPMFAVNGQQATPISTFGFEGAFREVCEKKKFAVYFPVISFPVKIRIIIGKPIFCGADESAEDFAQRARAAVEDLRDKHQKIPGSFISALMERFNSKPFHSGRGKREAK